MRLGFLSFALLASLVSTWAQSSVDSYISKEGPIAKTGLYANIGPNGSKSHNAKAGLIVASPSTSNPDYLFTWIRDMSLVMKLIIDEYTTGVDASSTQRTAIDNWVSSQKDIQQVSNPSGSLGTGGLGEPKFHIDGSAFTDSWGRPQRDGPALRANAMITWANYLLKNGNSSYVTNTLWPIIKLDLDYVASNWNQSTFDLWEEINSSSFFTTAVQHRSLRQGIKLATTISQTGGVTGYTTAAASILCFQQSYWNPSQGYYTSNTGGGRSGLDSNSVLTSIHLYDPSAGCDSTTHQPCSDKALSNLHVYVNSFRSGVYSINNGIAANAAVAVGRYREDVYFGGNPWYLSTFAVAEQLYDALAVWNAQGSLNVTSTSLAFFKTFSSAITPGSYPSSSSTFTSLTSAIKTYADDFIAINAKYTPSDGGLAEQFNKNNGSALSAVDLTWSYASAITAFHARSGFVPASWVPAGLSLGSCAAAPTVAVTFNVQATTTFGENIFLTGSLNELKAWAVDNAIALSADKYPTWSITLNLPANTAFQYKFMRKFNGAITWESDPNRSFTTGTGAVTINDTWR